MWQQKDTHHELRDNLWQGILFVTLIKSRVTGGHLGKEEVSGDLTWMQQSARSTEAEPPEMAGADLCQAPPQGMTQSDPDLSTEIPPEPPGVLAG